MKKIFLATVLFFASASVGQSWACGFKAEGLTKDNANRVHEALSTITLDFQLNIKTGEIYFSSEDLVNLKQVQKALADNDLSEVIVSINDHR